MMTSSRLTAEIAEKKLRARSVEIAAAYKRLHGKGGEFEEHDMATLKAKAHLLGQKLAVDEMLRAVSHGLRHLKQYHLQRALRLLCIFPRATVGDDNGSDRSLHWLQLVGEAAEMTRTETYALVSGHAE
jgi:hypothetical protein